MWGVVIGSLFVTVLAFWFGRLIQRAQNGRLRRDLYDRPVSKNDPDPRAKAMWAAFETGRPTIWTESQGVLFMTPEPCPTCQKPTRLLHGYCDEHAPSS